MLRRRTWSHLLQMHCYRRHHNSHFRQTRTIMLMLRRFPFLQLWYCPRRLYLRPYPQPLHYHRPRNPDRIRQFLQRTQSRTYSQQTDTQQQ